MLKRYFQISQIKMFIIIGYLTPIALLLWFVYNFSVNVPLVDQWTLVNFFDRVGEGKAGFGDFFGLNLEHRMLFPRIIFTILAFLSKWNTQLEQFCSIILAIIASYAMYKLSLIHI